jgi:hypothetical protein
MAESCPVPRYALDSYKSTHTNADEVKLGLVKKMNHAITWKDGTASLKHPDQDEYCSKLGIKEERCMKDCVHDMSILKNFDHNYSREQEAVYVQNELREQFKRQYIRYYRRKHGQEPPDEPPFEPSSTAISQKNETLVAVGKAATASRPPPPEPTVNSCVKIGKMYACTDFPESFPLNSVMIPRETVEKKSTCYDIDLPGRHAPRGTALCAKSLPVLHNEILDNFKEIGPVALETWKIIRN